MNNLVQTILGPANDGDRDIPLPYRVHRKNGVPFALFPADSRIQCKLAFLLPGQSGKARLYRNFVRVAGFAAFGFPRKIEMVKFSGNSALVSLIRRISKGSAAPILLPGNPNGIAPRLVFICLDNHNSPNGVIKVGRSLAARNLVRQEYGLLERIALRTEFVLGPRGLEAIETEDISAFAMAFVPGPSPGWPPNEAHLETFLSAAIRPEKQMRVDQLAPWIALEKALSEQGITWSSSTKSLGKVEVHPCLFHGDFAPWNVREGPNGRWTAIDWERGEINGIPGWDWLHFSLQPLILVKKWDMDRVLAHAQTIVGSAAFLRYFGKAYIGSKPSNAPALLLQSYLLYTRFVFMPPNCESDYRNSYDILATWATEQE